MQYPCNQGVEPVRSNGELHGALCEKRQDAVVVMDNKYFITLVSVRLVKIPRPLVQ